MFFSDIPNGELSACSPDSKYIWIVCAHLYSVCFVCAGDVPLGDVCVFDIVRIDVELILV
jgi:hypothetical protein